MNHQEQSADSYDDRPTAVIFDVFAETATRLIGRYSRLSDNATNETERERWWGKVIQLRDAKRTVPADNRAQMIAHISRWSAEIARLENADLG